MVAEAASASEQVKTVSDQTEADGGFTSNSSIGVVGMVKAGQHQPRTLSGLTKAHIIHVAATGYEVQLDSKAKVDLLREQLQAQMEKVVVCDNVACAGGPCNAGVHVFTAAQFLPEGEDSAVLEQLLQMTQTDEDTFSPAEFPLFLRDRVVSRQAAKRPAPAALPGPGPAGGSSGPEKNKRINGVPPDTLKAQRICIKWNVGTCLVQASRHDSPDRSDTQQVWHICGGCWFLNHTEDESHSMKTCKKKNSQGLFQ